MANLTILIADDQALLADALQTIMELEGDLQVVGTVHDGQAAFEQTMKLKPDVVLMDVQMPGLDGLASLKRIKGARPGTVVLMLTTFDNDAYVVQALAAGADGFLLKDIRTEQLAALIRQAVHGYVVLPGAVAARLAAQLAQQALPGAGGQYCAELSAREREIAVLIARGLGNREIARQLHLSEGTVKNYISVIYEKVGTNDRIKAVELLRHLEEGAGV